MEGDTEIQQEIVVAAVDEPGHGAEAFQCLLIGLVDEIQGGMLPDGALLFIGDYPILSPDRGKELLEKEILITPGQSIR